MTYGGQHRRHGDKGCERSGDSISSQIINNCTKKDTTVTLENVNIYQ